MDGARERLVDDRFVLDDPRRLDSARGGHDDLGFRVFDPGRELLGREASENDRMHRAEPSTSEHRDRGLGDHRHVHDDAVALPDAERGERAGEACDVVQEFRVGEPANRIGDGGIPDQRGLVAAAVPHVPVERVERGVQLPVREPAVERRLRRVERPRRRTGPVDRLRGFEPETLRVFEAPLVRLGVHRMLLRVRVPDPIMDFRPGRCPVVTAERRPRQPGNPVRAWSVLSWTRGKTAGNGLTERGEQGPWD